MRLTVSLIALAALAACGGPASEETASTGSSSAAPATETPTTESAPAAAEPEPAAPTYDLSGLPAEYQDANVSTGGRRFAQCRSCHQIGDGTMHSVGPDLHGVFGRTAGTLDFPTYSDELKASGIVWSAETIDEWITNPKAVIPDTSMTYVGMRDPVARRDLIAWLWVETNK